MKKILLFLMIFTPLITNAALVTWTGAGDGTTWTDAANWDTGTVPGTADDVVFTGSSVMFDLTIPVTVQTVEIKSGATLTITSTGVLNLGNDDGVDTNGALDLNSPSGFVINNGTINITNANEDAIDSRGTFTNNGLIVIGSFGDDGITVSGTSSVFTNNGTITIDPSSVGCVGDVGLHTRDGGVFTNSSTGVVNITNTLDEAIFIGGTTTGTSPTATSTINNSGLISTSNSGQCVDSSNNGIEIRGTFNNNAGGTFKDVNSRGDAIRIEDSDGGGTLNNAGTITIDISSNTSDGIENQNVFTSTGVIEIGCPGINELEVNNGDLNLGSSCINFDINDDASGGTDYDRFDIRNTVLDISGATAKLVFGSSYVPTIGDCFRIVNANSDGTGTINGTFASVTSSNPNVILTTTYMTSTNNQVEVCIDDIISPLPVGLISFEGRLENEVTVLDWATENEINNDYFEIEHSTNGRDFSSIAKVDGNGNSTSVQNYKYIHKDPTNGDNYYRLKQVDFDGNFEYFNIIYIQYNKSNAPIAIYPNPAQDVLFVEGESSKLTVYDINGRPVITQTTEEEISTINISNLEVGLYMIEISTTTNEKVSKRFIKK